MAMLLARMRPTATAVMRRSFSTAPATMTEGAVAAKAGAGEIAPLAIPMSYGLKEFAILPMTIATNNIHLLIAGARWGIAGGLFLYMMIRPGEWASVRSRVASLATRALSVLCQMPARQLNNRRGEQPRTQTHRGSCAPLCTASNRGDFALTILTVAAGRLLHPLIPARAAAELLRQGAAERLLGQLGPAVIGR
jgi:hypothetical protein